MIDPFEQQFFGRGSVQIHDPESSITFVQADTLLLLDTYTDTDRVSFQIRVRGYEIPDMKRSSVDRISVTFFEDLNSDPMSAEIHLEQIRDLHWGHCQGLITILGTGIIV